MKLKKIILIIIAILIIGFIGALLLTTGENKNDKYFRKKYGGNR